MKSLVIFAALIAVAVATPFNAEAYARAAANEPEAEGLIDLAKTLGLTTLVDVIGKAGLTHTLNNGGPYTLFAPTNEALAALSPRYLANITDVAMFLKYHVAKGKILSPMIEGNIMVSTLVEGISAPVSKVTVWPNTNVFVSGALVTEFDHVASNGVIHIIDRFMGVAPNENMVGVLEKSPGFSILLDLLKITGLDAALKGTGPFTVFAPRNAAFVKLGADLTNLMKNKTLLTEVLKYHVVPGRFFPASTPFDSILTTLDTNMKVIFRTELRMTEAGKMREEYFIDDSRVILDQAVSNGVVWMLEDVLSEPLGPYA